MRRSTRRKQPPKGVKPQLYTEKSDVDSASEPPETIAETGSRRTLSNEPEEVMETVTQLSNFLPSEQEVRQAQTLISQYEREYEAAQAEYQVKKQELDALAHRMSTIQSRIFEKRASIAPIRRVPQDVLSMIFGLCVRENATSPWTLMHVCRSWRAAAMHTAMLWNRIMIAPSNWAGRRKGAPKFYEGMEVCTSAGQLERAIKQAGSTPLEVRLLISGTVYRRWVWAFSNYDPNEYSNQEREVHKLLGHLNDLNIRVPLRALEIDTGERFSIPEKYLQCFVWTDIERLVLDGEYPMILSAVVESGARNLKVLSLDYPDIIDAIDTIPWAQLKELGVINSTDPLESPLLIDALRRCSNVETLTLKDLHTFEWTSGGGKSDNLSGLRDLWLHNNPIVIDPIVVKVCDMTLTSKYFALALFRLVRCQRLHAIRTPLGPEFFETPVPAALVGKRKGGAGSGTTIPLRSFREFIFDFMGGKKVEDGPLQEAAKSFIRRREELGAPIQKLDIRTQDGTWHDLVELVHNEQAGEVSDE
ncbi:SubName: Full=Uncharacterized protein {ECO:0000313/EMBL:CCA75645.1} [Serendipita indica DSM 11827]|nr:SubName: Full=Uncharacterized protein {ECO:0000313/EMBL:CCA75645.1} [Serendipita indica DSM 11827]